MNFIRIISSLLIGFLGVFFAFLLLIHGYLKGAEFVAFSLGVLLLAFILTFWKDVSELSIGGNIVKLNQAKSELADTVSGLKISTREMLKMHLKLVKNPVHNGFYDEGSNKDERIDNFWHLYQMISEMNLEQELARELNDTLDVLLRNQLFAISCLCLTSVRKAYPSPFDVSTLLPSTRELQKLAIANVESDILASGNTKSLDCYKDYVLDGIEYYDKLLKLSVKFA